MGRSLFAGRAGQRVASPCVTLVDDGRLPGACDSAPVDGEGTPTAETTLIEDGVLRGFFHSAFTARRMGARPGGNGVRGGYLSAPEPSPTSLLLRPTGVSRDALLGSVASGIYVTEWMGLHDVNTSTGDFSLGATGRAIETAGSGAPSTGWPCRGTSSTCWDRSRPWRPTSRCWCRGRARRSCSATSA